MRLRFQAKPEAAGLIVGTVALLIASTSSILVVCANSVQFLQRTPLTPGYLLILFEFQYDFSA